MKLVIEINQQGEVQVNGPLKDKIACYGMLETARDAIQQFNAQPKQPEILRANQIPKIVLKK